MWMGAWIDLILIHKRINLHEAIVSLKEIIAKFLIVGLNK